MKRTVYILATCRKPELLRATTLVFDTLRTGFPTSDVMVCVNPCTKEILKRITDACLRANVTNIWNMESYVVHHDWIEKVFAMADGPSVICDTDMIFWDKCEDWEFNKPLAGRLVPAFEDTFTTRRTHSRLHTSLMVFAPSTLREEIRTYNNLIPESPFKVIPNLIRPLYYTNVDAYHSMVDCFFDTCALLYHAIGGEHFTEHQKDCYDHLQSGTVSDIVSPAHEAAHMRELHEKVFAGDLQAAHGIWRGQERYQNECSVV